MQNNEKVWKYIYCVDTSSLIEMRACYPRDIFPTLWRNIEGLCREGRIIAPIEVKKEIEEGDDELIRWLNRKDIRKIFIEPNETQMKIVADILKNYSFLAKPEKPGPNADPWLIALAIEQNNLLFNKCIVVTEESKEKPNRIPAVCRNYNIECIRLIELFRREEWKF